MQRRYQKIKKQLYFYSTSIASKIGYRYLEISNGAKISIFAAFLGIISLFLPWLESLDSATPIYGSQLSVNAFSSLTGLLGYLILPLLCFIVFSLVSSKRKERLKLFSLVDIPDRMIVLLVALLIFILSIQYFFIVGGLQRLNQNIIFGSGLILATTSSILFFLGHYLLQSSKRKKTGVTLGYEDGISNFKKQDNSVGNMKLPF